MPGSGLWIPQTAKPAVKRVAVVFYVENTTKRITVGAPDEFPAPRGYTKVVARTAAEVDLWSSRIREQERILDEMTEEQREAIEGPIRDAARKELIHLMLNARNDFNRDFCRAALAKMDEDEAKRKEEKISYMHVEGFEDRH